MSRLLIDEPPLQILPTLACEVGLPPAVFLQQLHFKLLTNGVEIDGRLWVKNTYEEWRNHNFPFFSVKTLKRIVKELSDNDYIIVTEEHNKNKSDRTLWYTINYERFGIDKHSSISHSQRDKLSRPAGQNDLLREGQNVPLVNTREEDTYKNTPQPPSQSEVMMRALDLKLQRRYGEGFTPSQYSKRRKEFETLLKTESYGDLVDAGKEIIEKFGTWRNQPLDQALQAVRVNRSMEGPREPAKKVIT